MKKLLSISQLAQLLNLTNKKTKKTIKLCNQILGKRVFWNKANYIK